MIALALLLCQLSLLPPLSEAEAEQVRTGVGAAEVIQDAAFEALLANIKRWETLDEADTESIELFAVEAVETLVSGGLWIIEGDLLRAEPLPAPFDDLRRWIIALPESREGAEVLIAFLPADPSLTEIEALESPRVRLPARWYKVMRLPAGGGLKSYPALVGAQPTLLRSEAQTAPMPVAFAWILLGVGLLLVLFFLGVLTRASAAAGRLRAEQDLSRYDPTQPLPRKPAEALDLLARQAEKESP